MAHVDAVHTWEEFKVNIQHGTTIARTLDKIGKNVIKEIVTMSKPLRRFLLCAKQEIALRGHDETGETLNTGNLGSLLTFIGKHGQIVGERIKEGPQSAKYTSREIQNELLGVMSDMVLQTISNEVQKAGIYSLLADGTKDISRKEQLSIVLRYVNNGRFMSVLLGILLQNKWMQNHSISIFVMRFRAATYFQKTASVSATTEYLYEWQVFRCPGPI
ncbi:Zinc finger MYM-type protein 1-like [Oopsacas minuta]|uniref:Zinc finger MYM-type protein 1-like n=1 Tax=Oopsacas minuta TaxID=111878 RepID=A0AAV7KB72_9METZ|nr:Zinc finger MYM-type protein 1-like [Oopsacas minuta]